MGSPGQKARNPDYNRRAGGRKGIRVRVVIPGVADDIWLVVPRGFERVLALAAQSANSLLTDPFSTN